MISKNEEKQFITTLVSTGHSFSVMNNDIETFSQMEQHAVNVEVIQVKLNRFSPPDGKVRQKKNEDVKIKIKIRLQQHVHNVAFKVWQRKTFCFIIDRKLYRMFIVACPGNLLIRNHSSAKLTFIATCSNVSSHRHYSTFILSMTLLCAVLINLAIFSVFSPPQINSRIFVLKFSFWFMLIYF